MENKNIQNKTSKQKTVNIKRLPDDFWLYSNPMMLLFKGGKRAEAGQWTLEIQKMLRGIIESVIGLENIINQSNSKKRLFLENEEIKVSDEKKYWIMLYLIDNAILRIYACLDKTAQMCRCYFEHDDNGGQLEIISRCKCKYREPMTEKNCTFGNLLSYLNFEDDKLKRNEIITQALKNLDLNKSITSLRSYRNTFTHRKHLNDQSVGLDPTVKVKNKSNGTIETKFSFGQQLPSINWFRVEIIEAHNAIIECILEMNNIIFPRAIQIKKKNK